MMKRYKLLKDLPNLCAGTIFEYSSRTGNYIGIDRGDGIYFDTYIVQKNKDWFEEIKEKTDEEVLAFCLWQEYGKIVPDESKELADFLLKTFPSIRKDLQKLKGE